MCEIPEPLRWDSASQEPFSEYRRRWPEKYSHIPDAIIESWIHRHWSQFRDWRTLRPESWTYEIRKFTSSDVLRIGDVCDRAADSIAWGDDLMDGFKDGEIWLRDYMLENGTTPAPILVAENAAHIRHPHNGGNMVEPFQLIEGHRRRALLGAMIRRRHPNMPSRHDVVVARIPEC